MGFIHRAASGQLITVLLSVLSLLIEIANAESAPQISAFKLGSQDHGTHNVGDNQRIVLQPQLSGEPSPSITFYKDGVVVPPTSEGVIIIEKVKKSDEGLYWAVANNSVGATISTKIRLSLYHIEPWTDSDTEVEQEVNDGSAVILDVPPINSNPEPLSSTLKWYSGSQLNTVLSPDLHYYITTRLQLIIISAQVWFNNRIYQAEFRNLHAPTSPSTTRTKKFKLKVNGSRSTVDPEFVVRLPEISLAKRHSGHVLECVVNMRPIRDLVISWYKIAAGSGGTRVPISASLTQNNHRRCTVNSFTDGDVYVCEAGSGSKLISSSTTISIIRAPEFVHANKLSSVHTANLGTSQELPCSVTSNPPANITWYRNAVAVQTRDRLVISSNGSLTLHNIQLSDTAVYQCIAENVAGLRRVQTHLKLNSAPPSISQGPATRTQIAGETVLMSCVVEGKPTPNVTWIFKAKFGGRTGNLVSNDRLTVTRTEVRISSARWDDSGSYTCMANNSLGVADKTGSLTVYNITTIVSRDYPKEESKATAVTRSCKLNIDSRVSAQIAWFHNEDLIVGNSYRSLSDGNQTLNFNPIQSSDQGVYTCKVYSAAGNPTKLYNITITEVPLRINPKATLTEGVRRSITITWKAPFNGNRPILRYIIRYRETPDSEFQRLDAVSHSVTRYVAEDRKPSKTYVFVVQAANVIGEGQLGEPTQPVRIPAEVPSSPPTITDLRAVSRRSVRLSFTPPPQDHWNSERLLGYKIELRTSQTSDPVKNLTYRVSSGGIQPLQKEIESLLPYTEYWVRVAAFNEVSELPADLTFSQSRKVTTGEGKPTSPPQITNVTATSSTQCRLVWTEPTHGTIHGVIKGYYIKAYKGEETQPSTTKTVDPSLTDTEQTVLGGLEKYTHYKRITVSLFTGGGESPLATASCTTLQDTPEVVTDLAAPVWTHESITLSWGAPALANGNLKNYTVSIITAGQQAETHSTPLMNHTLTGLTAATLYTLSVTASTEIGPGPPATLTKSTRPKPTRPKKATGLKVENVRARSAVIKFTPGLNGKGPVTRWLVQWKSDDARMNWTELASIADTGSTRSNLTLDQLRPHQTYHLRIIAHNMAGDSDPSEPAAPITTLMAAPDGPPTNVSMRPQNYSTLIINWEPLDLAAFNGAAPRYIVSYKSQYETSWHNETVANPMKRFYIIDKLSAYTEYTVQVISANSEFPSKGSAPTTTRTIDHVPSRAPADLHLALVTKTNLAIGWSPLPPRYTNGVIIGYKVRYTPVGGTDDDTKTVTTALHGIRIDGLNSYVRYNVQILGYTRIGDGVPSVPLLVLTHAAPASPPLSFSMQKMETSSVLLVWRPPRYPNSPTANLNYILRYRRTADSGEGTVVSDLRNTYYAVSALQANTEYIFNLAAVNTKGEGQTTTLKYVTTAPSSHDVPDSPLDFAVKTRTKRTVTLTWRAGDANGLPIRNYTLWYRTDTSAYKVADVFIRGIAIESTLADLTPYTKYHFQLAAVNDKGQSAKTVKKSTTTSSDIPSLPPSDVQVIPKTATSLNVTWTAADRVSWNGQPISTRIWYGLNDPSGKKSITEFQFKDVTFPATTAMLDGLTPKKLYDIRLGSVNGDGYSAVHSRPIIIYVGVAVPAGAPGEVGSPSVTEQEITVTWQQITSDERNGQLLGYKVYYEVTSAPPGRRRRRAADSRPYDLVAPEVTEHTLRNLKIFRQYHISVTAYNIAGDGPTSESIIARTDQGRPGPPASLNITEITLELVNITWDAPVEPNGNITQYRLMSYPHDAKLDVDETENALFSTWWVTPPKTFDEKTIPPNKIYNFTVEAMTVKGAGEAISFTYISGPRAGVPGAPKTAEYSVGDNGVLLEWTSGYPGDSPTSGFIIEGYIDDWRLLLKRFDADARKVTLSRDVIAEDDSYSRYRVSLFNAHGLGKSKVAEKYTPYYRMWWFLVIIALGALVIIVAITAVLCCYCFRMRAKLAEEAYEQDVIGGESVYNTYEMRQSFKRENRGGSKYRAEPPRPSPGAVLYSADEVPPGYDDTSSVTEKGELSSDDDDTKGHASATDSSDDDIDKAGASSVTPSYNNYQYGGYNHYVQSGVVQQSWQNSFGRGRNAHNMYAYTDSEAESSRAPSTSHYRSTNGLLNTHSGARNDSRPLHLVNSSPDLPGSRAPLPGFSSFV